MATELYAGPVDYLVFTFDEAADFGPGLTAVLQRVDQGIIEILDIELIARDADGAPVKRSFSDFAGSCSLDLSVFDGVDSGILDADDLTAIAADLKVSEVAIAIIYEERSLALAADAWAEVGGVELYAGGVDIADLAQNIEEGNN